jgi:hypothetical protein
MRIPHCHLDSRVPEVFGNAGLLDRWLKPIGCGDFADAGSASHSYTITITGTSGAVQQTTTVQLTVQKEHPVLIRTSSGLIPLPAIAAISVKKRKSS